MTTNDVIVKTVHAVMRGELDVEMRPGFCLKVVRQIIESACDMPSHTLYKDYVTEWVQPAGYPRDNGHWARDFERSLRNKGMAIDPGDAAPGDILCRWDTAWSNAWGAYIGHVAIVMPDGFVFENVNPKYRKHPMARAALVLAPHQWEPSTVIRFVP